MSEQPTLGPCPLCGEAELVQLHENYDDECVVVEVDGETLLLAPLQLGHKDRNSRRFGSVDHVLCYVCGVMVPLRTWQGWRPTPAVRELYRAYYCDDDPQPWETTA